MRRRFWNGKIAIFNGENTENIYETEENITIPKELLEIAEDWNKLSKETGDIGACVIGAGLFFRYKDRDYKMLPQSPWQGEGSWTRHLDFVKKRLEEIGADNINYEWGMMD